MPEDVKHQRTTRSSSSSLDSDSESKLKSILDMFEMLEDILVTIEN